MASNKKSAIDFLNMVIAGRIDEAYQKYVDMNGKHHNPYFPKGFKELQKGMEDNHRQFPLKKFSIKNVLEDGNLVAVHSHLMFKEGEDGIITFHMFRFDKGKIVEMWDCGQPIQRNSPNKDGPF